jgi:hypothetical protein
LLNPAKTKCIASSLCLPALNDIVGGVCTPKAKCSQSGGLDKLVSLRPPSVQLPAMLTT